MQTFQNVKETLTLSDYEYLLVENGFKIYSKDYEHWRISSSCHNVEGGNPNLAFRVETGMFFCWSECNCTYDIFSLLVKRWGLINDTEYRAIDALKYICNYKGITFDINTNNVQKASTYNWKKTISKYLTKANTDELKIYPKSVLKTFQKRYHEDWLDFGISEETLEKYNIGYYPLEDCITIPVYNHNGDLVAVRGRYLNPDAVAKYRPVSTLNGEVYKNNIGQLFYGENVNEDEIKRRKRVDIVEAEKSVLKADTWFGDKNITLGLMGSAMTKARIDYLVSLGVEEVNLMLDSDFELGDEEAFHKFEEKVYAMYDIMSPYFDRIYVIYNNLNYKDMYKANCFDFDIERYNKLFDNRELL